MHSSRSRSRSASKHRTTQSGLELAEDREHGKQKCAGSSSKSDMDISGCSESQETPAATADAAGVTGAATAAVGSAAGTAAAVAAALAIPGSTGTVHDNAEAVPRPGGLIKCTTTDAVVALIAHQAASETVTDSAADQAVAVAAAVEAAAAAAAAGASTPPPKAPAATAVEGAAGATRNTSKRSAGSS